MNTRRTFLLNINLISRSKAIEIQSPCPKFDPSAPFHKITEACKYLKIVFKDLRRTFLPSINVLACSKAEI